MYMHSKLSEIDRKIKAVDADIKRAEEQLAKHKRGFLLKISLCAVAVIVALTMFGIYKKVNPTIDGVTYKLTNESGNRTIFFGNQYEVGDIKDDTTTATILAEVNGKPVIRLDFYGADSLKHISIPDSIVEPGNQTLDRLKNIEYNEYDNALYLGNEKNPYLILVKSKSKSITSCVIHEDTKFVYYQAFWNNENLEEVAFEGTNVFEIGGNAFKGCKKLVEIDLPDGLKRIGNSAFGDTSVEYFRIPNTVEEIDHYAFSNNACDCIKIPASVTKIGEKIMRGSTSVKIYCETSSKIEEWDDNWAWAGGYANKVFWGHKCEAGEWKTDNDGYSVLRCKDCKTILDEKRGN